MFVNRRKSLSGKPLPVGKIDTTDTSYKMSKRERDYKYEQLLKTLGEKYPEKTKELLADLEIKQGMEKIDKSFPHEFVRWLCGEGTNEEHARTRFSSNRKPLVGVGFKETTRLVDQMLLADMRNRQKWLKIYNAGPNPENFGELLFYYKYIVRLGYKEADYERVSEEDWKWIYPERNPFNMYSGVPEERKDIFIDREAPRSERSLEPKTHPYYDKDVENIIKTKDAEEAERKRIKDAEEAERKRIKEAEEPRKKALIEEKRSIIKEEFTEEQLDKLKRDIMKDIKGYESEIGKLVSDYNEKKKSITEETPEDERKTIMAELDQYRLEIRKLDEKRIRLRDLEKSIIQKINERKFSELRPLLEAFTKAEKEIEKVKEEPIEPAKEEERLKRLAKEEEERAAAEEKKKADELRIKQEEEEEAERLRIEKEKAAAEAREAKEKEEKAAAEAREAKEKEERIARETAEKETKIKELEENKDAKDSEYYKVIEETKILREQYKTPDQKKKKEINLQIKEKLESQRRIRSEIDNIQATIDLLKE